jgi:hypothetical protein
MSTGFMGYTLYGQIFHCGYYIQVYISYNETIIIRRITNLLGKVVELSFFPAKELRIEEMQ